MWYDLVQRVSLGGFWGEQFYMDCHHKRQVGPLSQAELLVDGGCSCLGTLESPKDTFNWWTASLKLNDNGLYLKLSPSQCWLNPIECLTNGRSWTQPRLWQIGELSQSALEKSTPTPFFCLQWCYRLQPNTQLAIPSRSTPDLTESHSSRWQPERHKLSA